jgi:hypothetical protein
MKNNNWILNYKNFLVEYIDLQHIKKVLPSKKFKHSKRVAELTKLIKDNKDIYSAAVYHDYLERGGAEGEMEHILSPYALELVYILTNDTDDDALLKLQIRLSGKSQDVKNDILIIKLCDRADNLKKRAFKNILSKNYIKKSTELIQWILDNYKGDKSKLKTFITNNIFPYIPKLTKKIYLEE